MICRCEGPALPGVRTPEQAARPGVMLALGGRGRCGPDPNPWTLHPAFPHIGDALQIRFRGSAGAKHNQWMVRNVSKYRALAEFTLWGILRSGRALPILYTCKELGDPTSGKCSGAPFRSRKCPQQSVTASAAWRSRQLRIRPSLPGIAGPMRTFAAITSICGPCLTSPPG